MAYSKKEWKGRLGTGLNKYTISSPDESGKQTITSNPDTITQEGDALSATNLNDFENRIDSEFTNVNNEITKIKDGTTVAKKAEGDEDGTNIKSTYAKKADYVPKADIVDGLSSSDATKVLSAKQGKVLDDAKAEKDTDAVTGNVAKFDANGNPIDSDIPSDNVAQQDGYYAGLTAGNAEQLLSSALIHDSAIYTDRTAGGGDDIGNKSYQKKIVGVTFCENQLLHNPMFTSKSNWAKGDSGSWAVNNGVASFSTVNTNTYNEVIRQDVTESIKTGNYYYVRFWIKVTPANDISTTVATLSFFNSSWQYTSNNEARISCGEWTFVSMVIRAAVANTKYFAIGLSRTSTTDVGVGTLVEISEPNLVDISQKLTSSVATYIGTLDKKEGAQFYEKYFRTKAVDYIAPSLQSVCVSSKENTGFNQWDGEHEYGDIDQTTGQNSGTATNYWRSKNYVDVIPNTEYYHNTDGYTGNFRVYWYDANKNYLSYSSVSATSSDVGTGATYTIPTNAYYMRFRYNTDLTNYNNCISIHWDDSRDGEYEPFKKYSYPMDSDVVLMGQPNIDSDGNLYFDGSQYYSDGTVVEYFKEYTFTGNEDGGAYGAGFWISIGSNRSGRIMAEYTRTSNYLDVYNGTSVCFCIASSANGNVAFYDPNHFTTFADMKAYLAGKKIIYYDTSGTPTTITATPFTEEQVVDNWGTEAFTDGLTRDVFVPPMVVADYTQNLRDKLEASPSTPDADGTYLMKRENGQNIYVAYTSPIPTESTDGTYVLKATVADGAMTLAWVAEEE